MTGNLIAIVIVGIATKECTGDLIIMMFLRCPCTQGFIQFVLGASSPALDEILVLAILLSREHFNLLLIKF